MRQGSITDHEPQNVHHPQEQIFRFHLTSAFRRQKNFQRKPSSRCRQKRKKVENTKVHKNFIVNTGELLITQRKRPRTRKKEELAIKFSLFWTNFFDEEFKSHLHKKMSIFLKAIHYTNDYCYFNGYQMNSSVRPLVALDLCHKIIYVKWHKKQPIQTKIQK